LIDLSHQDIEVEYIVFSKSVRSVSNARTVAHDPAEREQFFAVPALAADPRAMFLGREISENLPGLGLTLA
jgi:hypothetical protein